MQKRNYLPEEIKAFNQFQRLKSGMFNCISYTMMIGGGSMAAISAYDDNPGSLAYLGIAGLGGLIKLMTHK